MIRTQLLLVCIAAAALTTLECPRVASAQTTANYSTWSLGNPTQTMYPVNEWYCYLSGVWGLGQDETDLGVTDAVWVDGDANGNWELTGNGGPASLHKLGGGSYCIRYSSMQSPYSYDPWPTASPGGTQWYSSNVQQYIWDSQAFCNIGGLTYDGLSTAHSFPETPSYQVTTAPTESVIALGQVIQFITGGPDAIETQCLYFPPPGQPGFYTTNVGSGPGHLPAPGEVVVYSTSSSAIDLGNSYDQICALLTVQPSSDGAITAFVLQNGTDWWFESSNIRNARIGCIRLWQPWPGWPNGG
jgi:hypothetical protein